MQFDRCTRTTSESWTFYGEMKHRFEMFGYTIPNIIFWNVNSRNDVFHTQSDFKGVQLASGQSVSVFKAILQNMELSPYEAMLNILNSEVYKDIMA